MIQYFCQCQTQMGKCWNKWMALKTGSGSNAHGGGAFTEMHSSINDYSASMMDHLTGCYTWDGWVESPKLNFHRGNPHRWICPQVKMHICSEQTRSYEMLHVGPSQRYPQSVSKTWLNCTYIPVYWGKEAMSFNFFHSFWSCTWTQTQKRSTHNEVALALNELTVLPLMRHHLMESSWSQNMELGELLCCCSQSHFKTF